ncbi:hypothetical protein P3T39_007330, partial [Kitasatospora sp. GP82]|nr:hypothetical protein [Kitasatospora sp. GP82]
PEGRDYTPLPGGSRLYSPSLARLAGNMQAKLKSKMKKL